MNVIDRRYICFPKYKCIGKNRKERCPNFEICNSIA